MSEEEKNRIVQKAMTQLDGVEAYITQAFKNLHDEDTDYLMRSIEVHIADLRCDLESLVY